MWGFPRSGDPEGVDDGGAAGWGHPEWVEPVDMGPGEMEALRAVKPRAVGLDVI